MPSFVGIIQVKKKNNNHYNLIGRQLLVFTTKKKKWIILQPKKKQVFGRLGLKLNPSGKSQIRLSQNF